MITYEREVEINREMLTLLRKWDTEYDEALKYIMEHYEDQEEALYAALIYGGMSAHGA